MLFNTLRFFIFFAIVLVLFYRGPRSWRKAILLAASYYFYMSWNAKFVLLLLTLTCIDYFAALWITRSSGFKRKLALIISLGANIGFLGFFKYYNFLADSLVSIFGLAQHSLMLSIVLPVGISFHTFQSMSYVVDVYRSEQEAIRNPLDYALFIAFFPQLVAGPIVRAREFFADLYHWQHPTGTEVLRGLLLVLLGLTKKVVLADQFAAVADSYFNNITGNPGMVTSWSGVIAFALQIFFDFSGYTDMAIGLALLLGFHFPVNFRRPYLAVSITDFWRRWHISLSRWLRDYLYISFGGNRGGKLRTYRNLILTMLLGGCGMARVGTLSYGADIMARCSASNACWAWARRRGAHPTTRRFAWRSRSAWYASGGCFFRAANFHDSVQVIEALFNGSGGPSLLQPWHFLMIAVTFVLALAEETDGWFERLVEAPAVVYASAIVFLLLCLELLSVTGKTVPFVYFQF